MRRTKRFLILLAAQLLLLAGLLAHGGVEARRAQAGAEPALRETALRLGLTDLALWTEARYTRHPSQADFFSPFQDFPASLEHFPAGSLTSPPMRGADLAGR